MPEYRLTRDIKRGYEIVHRAGELLVLTDEEAAWYERDSPGALDPAGQRADFSSPSDRMFRGGQTRGHDFGAGAEAETEVVDATPAALALAENHGIDLATVTGSGTGGRILVSDVKALIEE